MEFQLSWLHFCESAGNDLFITLLPMKTRGVSHCGLAIHIQKDLKAKEELMEAHIFHHAKI
jgi:hypothetical protein